MPFINVRIAGPLDMAQTDKIQKEITSLMVEVLKKEASVTAVLVEQHKLAGWTIDAEPVPRAAQVDVTITAGTNTPEQKAQFIAAVNRLLRDELGPDLPKASYIVIHEVPRDSWGYGGLTQAHRARVLETQ